MKKWVYLSVVVSLFCFGSANANQRASFVYDSLSDKLLEETKAELKVRNDPEVIAANAQYIKQFYDALVKQGFSKEEALQLVSASLSD